MRRFMLSYFFCLTSVSGMSLKITDLSYDLNNDTIHWPTATAFQLFIQHRGPVDLEKEEDETNYWYEMNDFKMSEHAGTHLDAPVHFARNRWSVDEIPSERFISPVTVVDLREKVQNNTEYEITKNDLLQWESRVGTRLSRLVIFWTGWSSRWHNKESYLGTSTNGTSLLHFPGLHPDAAQWLVDSRHVHGVGIDTASIDYGRTTTSMSHRILAAKNIFILENLNTNPLAAINLTAFENPYLIVNPLKITAGSGSPIRPLLVDMSSLKRNNACSPSRQSPYAFISALVGLFFCMY